MDVRDLVYSEKFGRKSFNLDVADREVIMQALLDGEATDVERLVDNLETGLGENAFRKNSVTVAPLADDEHLWRQNWWSDHDAYF